MNKTIRKIKIEDISEVMEMMKVFYNSPAVYSNGSEEIFLKDIECCINDSPYLEGYIFEEEQKIQGYAMVAKSFSTEFGKPCIWIEDLYIKEEYRGMGIGRKFIDYIKRRNVNAIFRLEVEEENEGAVRLYKSCGFDFLPYMEMKM